MMLEQDDSPVFMSTGISTATRDTTERYYTAQHNGHSQMLGKTLTTMQNET